MGSPKKSPWPIWSRLRKLLQDDHGGAMVEFALAGSVFTLVLLAIFEFGTVAWIRNSISESARDGTRWAMVRGATSGRVADSAAVSAYVRSRSALSPIRVVTTWPTNKDPDSYVQVRVQYFYRRIGFIHPSDTLRSTSKVMIVF